MDHAPRPPDAGGPRSAPDPSLPDALIITGPDARITAWNHAAAALYGWSAADALGRPLDELLATDYLGADALEVRRQLDEQGVWNGRVLQRRSAGHTVTVAASLALIRGAAGEPVGLVCVSRDISAQTQAELQLRAYAARLEILAEASRIFALAGGDEQAILDTVARVTAEPLSASCIVRLRLDEPEWLHAVTVYDPDPQVQEAVRQAYTRAPVHIDSPNFSATVVRTGQPLFMPVVDMAAARAAAVPGLWATFERFQPHSIIVTPLRAREQILGALSFTRHIPAKPAFTADDLTLAQDLSDRAALAIANARLYQQAQRELAVREAAEHALEAERALLARRVAERTADLSLANAELARAARLKDEFLANMSHELRTPLNTILGRTETIEAAIYGPVTPQQVAALQAISESGRHLLSLINDILDLSKIETGHLTLDRAPVDVGLLGSAALRMVAQLAAEKQITLTSTFDGQLYQIVADERRLKQILVNLLTNAVKFTPKGGRVGLEVSGSRAQHLVTFAVWDTGIGIAAEDIERLFQPFVQLDSSLSRQYEGTGLGLALVHRLAAAHGGSVSVESAPGRGSRFAVRLPWSAPEPATLAAPLVATQLAGGREPRVLLVDDSAAMAETVVDYLRARGYEVLVAHDGREAVARALAERPDVILMDIQMPGVDGLQAIRQIRADAAGAHVAIIALTALVMPGDRERCLEAGADAYMSKPVSLRALAAAIAARLPSAAHGPGSGAPG